MRFADFSLFPRSLDRLPVVSTRQFLYSHASGKEARARGYTGSRIKRSHWHTRNTLGPRPPALSLSFILSSLAPRRRRSLCGDGSSASSRNNALAHWLGGPGLDRTVIGTIFILSRPLDTRENGCPRRSTVFPANGRCRMVR